MTIEKLRDKIIGVVLEECSHIPREFVSLNWDYLKTSVDSALNKSSKFLIKRKPSLAFILTELCSSLILYYLLNILELDLKLNLAICGIILLNLEMLYYREFSKLFYRLFVFFSCKVKNYCSLFTFGYNLVYIGLDGKKVVIIPLDKIKGSIKLENPCIYVISKDSLYSIIFDYLTNKNSLNFDFIKYEVFLNLNQAHINSRVLDELEKLNNS